MLKRCAWLGSYRDYGIRAFKLWIRTHRVLSEAVSYKDMKSMVIDILKTEDAQKALTGIGHFIDRKYRV